MTTLDYYKLIYLSAYCAIVYKDNLKFMKKASQKFKFKQKTAFLVLFHLLLYLLTVY